MDQKDRDAIQRNFSTLVERTDLVTMVAALYEKGVFSARMIEQFADTGKDVRDRKRKLYSEIPRRGPQAFKHLLDALQENGYWDIVRDLDPKSSLHKRIPPSSQPPEMLESFISVSKQKRKNKDKDMDAMPVGAAGAPGTSAARGDAAQRSPEPTPTFNVIKSKFFFEDNEKNDIKLYRTRGRQRGVLIMFSYVKFENEIETARDGVDVDVINLKYLFDELGFKVISYLNLSLEITEETLRRMKQSKDWDLGSPDTVFVMFSSHGYEKRRSRDNDIRCSDGGLISLHDIIQYFNNDNFPALRGIPKVFIFQNCRGNQMQHNRLVEPDAWPDGTPTGEPRPAPPTHRDQHTLSAYTDIFIAHSTVPGYVSLRHNVNGSYYIQALCQVFAAHAHDTHVASLFQLVDLELGRRFKAQTSSVELWGFNKKLYLHPGLYEDEAP